MKTKLQAFIIDDEQDGRAYIALLLKREFPDIEIAFEGASVAEAYAKLVRQVPDILFLDIQLDDGDAFELLAKFDTLSCQVLFVTAYGDYAIRAIRHEAVDYLMKPIDKNDFIIAVSKAIANINRNKPHSVPDPDPKINLPTLQGFKRARVQDIIRCEADSNYTIFYLTDKSRITVSKTLHTFEPYLLEHQFFRIHHKHLINLNHVSEYIKGRGGQVIMSDHSALDVSERKKAEFLLRI